MLIRRPPCIVMAEFDSTRDAFLQFDRFFVAAIVALSAIQPLSHAAEKIDATGSSITRTPPKPDPGYPITQPIYPTDLANAGVEGQVILNFHVRANGSVDAQSIKVEKSTGTPALDQSAVEEATKWRFLPATENGQPVGSDHQFRVVFDRVKSRSDGSAVRMKAEDFPGTLRGESDQSFVPMNMER
jgi:TonB family protein